MTMSAAQTPVIWVRAPLVTAVPVRLRLPHTLMPPLSPAPMLAMPPPRNSESASIR